MWEPRAMNAKTVRNVPPPLGAENRPSYGRFIPREELEGAQAWQPDSLGDQQTARPPISAPAPKAEPKPPPPPPPHPRELLAAARQAGYQDGYRDGNAAAEAFKAQHARQVAVQLGALVQSFDAAFGELEARMAEALTHSAVELAKQVVREELRIHPEHIARIAHDAVEALMLSARHVRVYVNPADLPLVEAGAADALRSRGAQLVGEPSIERGGCQIESDIASVDALIAKRWQLAAQQLGTHSAWHEPEAGDGLVEEN
ncbi:flagellar assembly protein FliH [Inhella inkyongensis]|uniref:Flagellar assembly protein FliH n=1 Tax=Inhella inkyongensis TaxID=392593 RepID=A0A840SBR2_9BURK|nr:FliH/SctL family protein [Inhella inkyongensis]MBB5205901.1 flagellar assembly protein FliH [Inhella inkyongensis]